MIGKGVVDMQILNLSKEDGEAIIRLDTTELTTLCNAIVLLQKRNGQKRNIS